MRAWTLRIGFAGLLIWAGLHTRAEAPGSLHVDIREPAMVCITSLQDHQWRVPPDGSAVPAYSRLPDFYNPKPWQPGQIGYVRLTGPEPRDNQARVPIYQGQTSYPYWKEPASYFVTQPFSISLPAGKWRLAVARGLEFEPHYEEFEIAAGSTVNRTIALKRWVDMPKSGWYSGDTHVHFPRMTPEQSEFLLTWARAEDVHLASILHMGDSKAEYFGQAAYGPASRYQKGDYAIATGQEDPRTDIAEQGHCIALNITAPVRDVAKYHLYDTMFDGVHQQPGALAGYAHLAWASDQYNKPEATWDPTINAIRGKVDFFEVLQFRHLGVADFYDFLNLGIRLAAVAGSDLPWGSTIGEVRTFAYIGSRFTPEAWYDAVKHGRTFVTNGPMLDFTVDGQRAGDEVHLAKPGKVRIHARAWAAESIGEVKSVEVIADGRVIRTAAGDADFTLDADRSQWLAVRATSVNGAFAHTSPVYVIVGGAPVRDTDAASIAQRKLKELDYITAKIGDLREYRNEQAALLERIAAARVIYQGLLSKGE
jgi:hypothetical protein